MSSKKYRTYYSEKEKVYAIQEIKENIIALECDITKIHQNLKSIGRKINYLYDAITESSESSTSESSSAEEAYTIEEEPRESVFMPLNKVKCVKKRSCNKKVKRNGYPSRSVNVEL
ncbi:7948_t:CDS:1, partial [Funneliformis geosporum]